MKVCGETRSPASAGTLGGEGGAGGGGDGNGDGDDWTVIAALVALAGVTSSGSG